MAEANCSIGARKGDITNYAAESYAWQMERNDQLGRVAQQILLGNCCVWASVSVIPQLFLQ